MASKTELEYKGPFYVKLWKEIPSSYDLNKFEDETENMKSNEQSEINNKVENPNENNSVQLQKLSTPLSDRYEWD